MWLGTAFFLTFLWGMGFGDGLRAYEEEVKVVRKARKLNRRG